MPPTPPTDPDAARAAASERARQLRRKRLSKPRGLGVAATMLVLAFFAPGLALWLVILASVVTLWTGYEAWLGRRHDERIRRRRAAAKSGRSASP